VTAEGALARGFVAAESRGGCSLTADGASVGVVLDAFVADVVGSLHPSTTVNPCGATKLWARHAPGMPRSPATGRRTARAPTSRKNA
jgi:hypothetical protein